MYEISGHWDHFAEAMFPPIDDGAEQVVLRPMNCPHHIVAYRSPAPILARATAAHRRTRGHVPQRTVGVPVGLSRVRAMVLNDAHHFLDPARIAEEVALVISMIEAAYADLGLSGHHYRLSLRGDGAKYVADPGLWDRAEVALAGALDDLGVGYEPVRGEAAFYGPKIDVQVPGRGGRESFSSVQLDFHLPERFNLSYAGPGGPGGRSCCTGRCSPAWSAACRSCSSSMREPSRVAGPVQAVVLPVNPSDGDQRRAVDEVSRAVRAAGLRSEVDAADEPLGSRVRKARLRRVPYRVVVGNREAASGKVAVSLRSGARWTRCRSRGSSPQPPTSPVAAAWTSGGAARSERDHPLLSRGGGIRVFDRDGQV